jgi:hypothetical protein
MGFEGQNDPILVLDAKGGEIKGQSNKWISYHLRILKIVELVFVLSKYSCCLFCQKLASCGEDSWLWEKGEFSINFFWNNSLYVSTSVFDLEIGNWGWFAKTKPSGGKEWSKYAKFESKQICVFICIDVALLLVAFCCVGINHQKGGDWKGNVPLGHF